MNKKLEVRDLINVGLFAVLGFIFMLIGSFTAMVPVLMPIVPLVQGILVGPSNMLFSTKIKKPGMLFIQTMLISLAYVIMGHGPWALLTGAIAGFIGEIILKLGSYDSKGKSRLAFSFSSLCTLGNYVPIIISRNEYVQELLNQGYKQEFIDTMMKVMPDWILIVMAILGFIGAFVGCSLGIVFLKKHFSKIGK